MASTTTIELVSGSSDDVGLQEDDSHSGPSMLGFTGATRRGVRATRVGAHTPESSAL